MKIKPYIDLKQQTLLNERCIEIPIIISEMKGKVLEVGNVLARYVRIKHDVVDLVEDVKYKCNILDFKPKEKYDTIISISTLEHIGFDFEGKPSDVWKAIENLKRIGDRIIFTFPLGYNKYFDRVLLTERNDFNFKFYQQKNFIWRRIYSVDLHKVRYYKNRILAVCKWENKKYY